MAGGAYKITSLDPRYTRLYVTTNRRIYLQNLVNLLHASLHRRDTVRAYTCWAILVRCPEIDFRSTWKWALPVLDLVESDKDYPEFNDTQAASSSSSSARPMNKDTARLHEIRDGMDHRAKEAYLKRMLAVAHQWQKPEILTSLVVHLLSQHLYEEALQHLELYLTVFPFALSAIIHTYTGLVLFYLAQPRKVYPDPFGSQYPNGHSQFPNTQHYPSSPASTSTPSRLSNFSSLRLGDDEDDPEIDPDLDLRPGARSRKDLEGWDVARLRQALVRFNAAVEIEKDEEKNAADRARARAQYAGDPGLGVIRRAVGGSVARGFVKEIKAMLVAIDGRMTEDADSSGDEQKDAWSDQEDDAGEDDRMDEDDDDEEEEDNEDDGEAEREAATRNFNGVPPVTPKPRGRPRLFSVERTNRNSAAGKKPTPKTSTRTPTRTPNRTPRRSPELSPGPTPPSRSARSTRNLQPMYQTKSHPLDELDDEPAPPGQIPRMLSSDSSSSDGDDIRMERTPSGRGIKRKSRSRSRSRIRPNKGKIRDDDAYVDLTELDKAPEERSRISARDNG